MLPQPGWHSLRFRFARPNVPIGINCRSSYANQLWPQIESLIVSLKRDKPHWGRARSASFWSGGWTATCAFPPKSAIHALPHRHGLVKPIGWPHHRARAAINRFLHKHNPEPKPFTLSADSNKVIGVVRRGHQGLVSLHWVDYSTAR